MKIYFFVLTVLLNSIIVWGETNTYGCNKIPGFSLRNQYGDLISLDQILKTSKSKLILISFYQTTCTPCIEEIRYLIDTLKKNSELEVKLFDLILIDSKEERNVTFDFLKNNNLEKEMVLNDPYGKLDEMFNLKLIPKIVILDHLGRIIFSKEGKALSELRSTNKLGPLIKKIGLYNPCTSK